MTKQEVYDIGDDGYRSRQRENRVAAMLGKELVSKSVSGNGLKIGVLCSLKLELIENTRQHGEVVLARVL